MKQINKYILEHIENSNFSIVERLHINKDTTNYYNYHPKTKEELKLLINNLIKERGNEADLNDIDTSEITDMSYMFTYSKFNGDISNWDVSKVKNMGYMFWDSSFTGKNGDISNWDVSNVKNMSYMFNCSPLEKNPPKWYKE